MSAPIGAPLHHYRPAANSFGTAQFYRRNNALLAEPPAAVHPPQRSR